MAITRNCDRCGVEYSSKHKKSRFCCKNCKSYWWGAQIVERICPTCGATSSHSAAALRIFATARQITCALCVNRSGSNNPRWKGGHRHYSKGRHGKDKNGLSWKVQRRLAWERDNFTCQHCGKKDEKRKPDVHHKVPWCNSLSHDLENLICLCRSCHSKEDAKCHEQWGGQLHY